MGAGQNAAEVEGLVRNRAFKVEIAPKLNLLLEFGLNFDHTASVFVDSCI